MFHLVIDHDAMVSVTEHPSREVALAALLKFLDNVDRDHRVTHASWEHSRYELLQRSPHAAVAGYAVIDEICGCDHTFGDHDEKGCAAETVTDGRLPDAVAADPQDWQRARIRKLRYSVGRRRLLEV